MPNVEEGIQRSGSSTKIETRQIQFLTQKYVNEYCGRTDVRTYVEIFKQISRLALPTTNGLSFRFDSIVVNLEVFVTWLIAKRHWQSCEIFRKYFALRWQKNISSKSHVKEKRIYNNLQMCQHKTVGMRCYSSQCGHLHSSYDFNPTFVRIKSSTMRKERQREG